MRMNAIVAGVGITRFAKHMDTGLEPLGAEAVQTAHGAEQSTSRRRTAPRRTLSTGSARATDSTARI